jgi:predicted AAA+ superfamily ATPase
MKRLVIDKFIEWKNNEEHKPLMVLGVRQAGKTYAIREFCEKNYDNFVEINLLKRKDIVSIYNTSLNSDEKFSNFKASLPMDIEKENTIIFIDEIQESGELISELKFFNEEHGNINIISAGSLLGVMLKRGTLSFPVGQVEMINMFPLNFKEFLIVIGEEQMIPIIENGYKKNEPLVPAIHEKLLNIYKQYLFIGGMPEAVQHFLDVEKDISRYDKIFKEQKRTGQNWQGI